MNVNSEQNGTCEERKHDLLLYLKRVIYPKRWEIWRLYSPRLNIAQNPREWYITRSGKALNLKSKVRCWSKEKYASTVIYVWRFTQVFLRILLLRDLHCVSSKHPPVSLSWNMRIVYCDLLEDASLLCNVPGGKKIRKHSAIGHPAHVDTLKVHAVKSANL